LNRREFAAAGAAALAWTAIPHAIGAQDAPVRFGAYTIDATAEPFYAQQMGFFKDAGVNAVVTEFTSGNNIAAALLGGALDVGIIDMVSMATAHVHGLPLTLLGPAALFVKNSQTSTLMVRPASPINTAKDLNGKVIGTNGLKNIVQITSSTWIENNGGDPKTVKFVEVPVFSMADAIVEGRVDAAILAEPFVTNALASGKLRGISLADRNVAPEFLTGAFATTLDWSQKHPDVTKKVIAALSETAKWANANRPLSAAILTKISKLTPEIANRMGRAVYGERFSIALVQPIIDAAARFEAIPKSFPAAEIISPLALH
jgi:ABC-type nitrate/sulfonate/bicarbonate transport system substrate-binding protein